MIIVTGATGKLGRRTVERLLDRVPADHIGVSVRDPRKAQDLAGDIALPADGPVAWTGHDDLAEATAAILTEEEGRFEGPTPPLTGPAALDFDAVAEIAARATGRPFTRTVVPDHAFREQTLAHGAPAPIADLIVSIFAAARNGEFTTVDPTLAELIGREPAAFGALLEHAWAE
ncbi:hypothetical protein [Kitasatospora sp. NPDC047058]|uniref:hypothetical protein n=1 Tax=Kitasatospora sp. NPDC047058 TaxID=3155620 RepID=UPI0033ECBD78